MRRSAEPRAAVRDGFGGSSLYLALALVLVATLAAVAACSPSFGGPQESAGFQSDGERIYFTATSERGTPITADWQRGMMMGGPHMACVDCHGPQGRGGQVRMMMYTFDAPDIRYDTLTSDAGDEGMEHPPYTDETIKRAITAGVDPSGEPLEWPMPRWRMSDEDLSDLLAFIKSLSKEQP